MTDKNPQNKAEIPVNAPTTLARTTDTGRDGERKSKALPQANALKERFKAGSIPLQTDFADLIDLADIGRQAVGDEGTGLGLVKDSKNRLRFDPSKIANFTYDLSPSKGNIQITLEQLFSGALNIHERVALLALSDAIGPYIATTNKDRKSTTYTVDAVKINADGVRDYTKVKIIADKSVGKNSELLPFEYVKNKDAMYSLWYKFTLDINTEDFSNCTLVIDPLTLLVKHITDFSTFPLDGEIISLLTVSFVYHGVIIGDGLQKDNTKISAKVDGSKGLQVNSSGIGVNSGNGIAVNSSGVNVKLAKGAMNNGGGGQGSDGFTSIGSAGGLALSSNGLSVNAGNGIQINPQGVSIKLATNSGLSADETNGLKIVPEQMFQKGMVMMFAGTAAEIPKGWALCDGNSSTPNLIDRFILGSKPAESGKFNSASLAVSGNVKAYTKESTQVTVSGSVEIQETTLNGSQIPSHNHIGGMIYSSGNGLKYGTFNTGAASRRIETSNNEGFKNSNGGNRTLHAGGSGNGYCAYTSDYGDGKGHKHAGTMSTTAHKHTTDVIPPYYTLAFIIKV